MKMDGCNNGYGNDLCRFCAERQPGINIFSILGQEQMLYVKIQQCQFPFKVTMNDTLPKFICYNCISKVNMFNEFYHSAITLQTKLQSLLTDNQQEQKKVAETQNKPSSDSKLNKLPSEIYTIDLIKEDEEEPVKPKKPHLVSKNVSSSVETTSVSNQPNKNLSTSASQFARSCSSNPSSSLKVFSIRNHSSVNQKPNHADWVPPKGTTLVRKGFSTDGISNSTKSVEGNINGSQRILGTIDITGPKETDDVLTIDITDPDDTNLEILKVFSLSQDPSNHQSQHLNHQPRHPNHHSQQKEGFR